eukprot:CAMPEP_0172670522 /NCGR_PEP_ID=MMETSP1074-20121228/10353_1 /TAXON_ID=2916 /ORGANISM="Ceratium fusus, Strain PA161109" /LENGTH=66 /DNA_ID=CAMNT_0013487447 /DNA_START=55 /DNA_END=252 /DNA_ORIENTATION=+
MAVFGDIENVLVIATVAVACAGLISESNIGSLQLPQNLASPWAGDSQAPFLMAATIFVSQMAAGIV